MAKWESRNQNHPFPPLERLTRRIIAETLEIISRLTIAQKVQIQGQLQIISRQHQYPIKI